MSFSESRLVGQIWSWTKNDSIFEIILLTRIDKNKFCHGILLFIDNDEFTCLLGKEVAADDVHSMNSNQGWKCLT